jgi:hypothetical protein
MKVYKYVKGLIMNKKFQYLSLFLFLGFFDLTSQIRPDSINNIDDSIKILSNYYSIKQKQVRIFSTFAGENDVLKLAQITPGINAINDKTNEMSVHGFFPGNKLVLLDGVPFYYPTYNYNSMAIFSSDIVKSTKIFSNNFPASYGGKLFSVIDVKFKEGDSQNFHSNAEINPIIAKYTIEGPIIKNKLSFILSTRYNYSSLISDSWKDYNDSYISGFNSSRPFKEVSFYDICGKLSFELNKRNRFTYFLSKNSENLESQNGEIIKGQNFVQKVYWKHLLNNVFTYENSLSYSNHSYSNKQKTDYPYTVFNGIKEFALNSILTYSYSDVNYLKFGMTCTLHQINPYSLTNADSSTLYVEYIPKTQKSITTTIFVEDKRIINEFLTFNYGLRYNIFSTFGEDVVNNYINDYPSLSNYSGSTEYSNWKLINSFQDVEPRFNAEFKLSKNNILSIAYSYAKQYIHNLTISEFYYADILYPSNKYLKPQAANHFSIGFKHSFYDGMIDVGTEPYFALIDNINEIKDGATVVRNPYLETEIAVGTGKSYGIEFFAKKNYGKLSGWINYTLSKSYLKSKQINNNKEYPSPYQHLHNISAVFFFEVNKNWIISSNYIFMSGGYTTLLEYSYNNNGNAINVYSDRNKYQLSDYSKIDISSSYRIESKKYRSKTEISLGVYNLLNNKFANGTYNKRESPSASNDYRMYTSVTMYSNGFAPYIKLRYEF